MALARAGWACAPRRDARVDCRGAGRIARSPCARAGGPRAFRAVAGRAQRPWPRGARRAAGASAAHTARVARAGLRRASARTGRRFGARLARRRRACIAQRGASRGGRRDSRREGRLRHALAARRHRQRQDRGVPRGRGARCIAAAGRYCCSCPRSTSRRSSRHRVRAALPGVRIATLHSGLAAGERRAAVARGRRRARAQLVLGTRLAVFAPLPAPAPHRRRRGARRVVQAAGQRALPRARRRGLARAGDAAFRSCSAARRRRWSRGCTRARGATGGSTCRSAPTRGPACRRSGSWAIAPPSALEGIGEAPARGHRRRAGARRAIAGVRQPPRLRPVACLRRLQVGSAVPALQRAPDHAPRRRRRCAAIIAATSSRLPRACPDCGNVDLRPARLRHAATRARAATGVPRRAHRARRPRQHAAQGRVRGRSRAGRRQCARHPRRHADARQGPRLSAADAGGRARRRQRALQRRFPRDRAARRAAGAGGRARRTGGLAGRSHRADRLSRAPGVRRAARARLRALRRHAARRSASAAALPPFTHAALLAAEAQQRGDVDAFLRPRTPRPSNSCSDGIRRSTSSRRCPRCSRAAPDSSAARSSCKARAASALQRFLPQWRAALGEAAPRRVRWALDVDPAGFG